MQSIRAHTERRHDWKMGCQVILIRPVEVLCTSTCSLLLRSSVLWCRDRISSEVTCLNIHIHSHPWFRSPFLLVISDPVCMLSLSRQYLPGHLPISKSVLSLLFQSTIRINLSSWSSVLLSPFPPFLRKQWICSSLSPAVSLPASEPDRPIWSDQDDDVDVYPCALWS